MCACEKKVIGVIGGGAQQAAFWIFCSQSSFCHVTTSHNF